MESKRSLVGLLYLAGAGLSAHFLLWYGGWALFAALLSKGFDNLAAPEQPKPVDVSGIAITGAVMASVGLCLTLGLLTLGIHRLSRKAYPRRRAAKIFLVFSSILISSTTLFAWRLTASDPVPARYADVSGIWHRADDNKQTCRFNPDGTIDSWWSGMGGRRSGRWGRSGQTITMIDDRDWQVVGTISGSSITGVMSVTSTGKPLGNVKWVRDVKP
jgi:hypothetical protein